MNRMKTRWLSFLLLVLFVCIGTTAQAAVTIKLSTIAPKGSPWYDALAKMGEEWKKVSKGEVRLKIYPGGVVGNEIDMVRKMRQGRLHAATITSIGVREIDATLLTLQVPGLVENNAELNACFAKTLPMIEANLEKEGFVLLQYGNSGWVHFFTHEKMDTLKQLQATKLFLAAGDPKSQEAWTKAGFLPISINATDILPSLQTGLIGGFASPPLAALAMQWFGMAKYMIDVKVAPLVGATVISKKQWEKIPEALRPQLKAIAVKYGKEEGTRIANLDGESIDTMKKYGLTVVPWKAEEQAMLKSMFQKQWSFVRGNLVPADTFDLVQKTAKEMRK